MALTYEMSSIKYPIGHGSTRKNTEIILEKHGNNSIKAFFLPCNSVCFRGKRFK